MTSGQLLTIPGQLLTPGHVLLASGQILFNFRTNSDDFQTITDDLRIVVIDFRTDVFQIIKDTKGYIQGLPVENDISVEIYSLFGKVLKDECLTGNKAGLLNFYSIMDALRAMHNLAQAISAQPYLITFHITILQSPMLSHLYV